MTGPFGTEEDSAAEVTTYKLGAEYEVTELADGTRLIQTRASGVMRLVGWLEGLFYGGMAAVAGVGLTWSSVGAPGAYAIGGIAGLVTAYFFGRSETHTTVVPGSGELPEQQQTWTESAVARAREIEDDLEGAGVVDPDPWTADTDDAEMYRQLADKLHDGTSLQKMPVGHVGLARQTAQRNGWPWPPESEALYRYLSDLEDGDDVE